MAFKDVVSNGIDDVLRPNFNIRNGTTVPKTENIALTDGAVRIKATYLYADMANSTALAQNYKDWATAKVIRCYLNAATRIIKWRGGFIRSFDGDRVMGIFIGSSKNTSAVTAALNISWAVESVIQPKLEAKWSDFKWKMAHGIGVDTGEALIVRGGVQGENDLISVGSAPNIAAKLSDERGLKSIYISKAVYDKLHDDAKYASQVNMWIDQGIKEFGGNYISYFGSSYIWEP